MFRRASLLMALAHNWRYALPSKKIGYIGWHAKHTRNIGDYAIYCAFNRLFNKYSVLPFKLTEKTTWYENRALKGKLYDAILVNGGTVINTPETLKLLRLAQDRYNKTFVMGSGVRDPAFWEHHAADNNCISQWAEALKECSFVGVRGPYSKGILSKAGFNTAEVTGDPSLHWGSEKIKPKKGNRRIAINVCECKTHMYGSDQNTLEFAVRLIHVLMARGWQVSLYNASSQDSALMESICNAIRQPIYTFNGYQSIRKSLQFFEQECDIFVGQRMHSVALACCTFTPSIMLEYQPKCRDFMASMEIEPFTMRTDMFSLEQLLNWIDMLTDQCELYQIHLKSKVDNFKQVQQDKRDYLVSKLIS